MRADQIEQAKHFAEQLEKKRNVLTRMTYEATVEIRMHVFAAPMGDGDPDITIGAEDREFNQVMQLARDCLRRDIASIIADLRSLGVEAA